MKLVVRRVGNSLGVIIPQATLINWGVGEGDQLHLSASAIRPLAAIGNPQDALDELERQLAVAVAARFTAQHIRAHSLANLHRWHCSGTWVSAYDEWQQLLLRGDDGELFATLLGRDEHCKRLRQSPPYVGMLPQEEVAQINDEWAPSTKSSHRQRRSQARRAVSRARIG